MRKIAVPLVAALFVMIGCAPETSPEPAGTGAAAAETATRTAEGPGSRPPAVGEPAPGFDLTDLEGNRVTLADARGRAAVLVFYRGHW